MSQQVNNNQDLNNTISVFGTIISPEEIDSFFGEYRKLMAYYRCAMMEMETKLKVLNEEFSLQHDRNPISSVKTRLKSPPSVQAKLQAMGEKITVDNIENKLHDVAGVRVICSFEQDVYTLAEALLRQDDISLIEIKDYIKNPKSNGYRSLHIIVSVPIFLVNEKKYMKVEIQLRTIAMDSWADLEHQLKYKKNGQFSDEMAYELYLCSQLSTQLDKRMDALREKLKL